MKLIKSFIFITILVLFSFYYTNETSELIKQYDPIMIKIKEEASKYQIEPVNATIKDNPDKIIEIDIEKSYSNMKKNNVYSDNLLVYNEILPKYSYNNYITNKLNFNNKISLLFTINNIKELKILEELADLKQVELNIFVNKQLLVDNYDYFKNISKFIILNNNDYDNFLEVNSLIKKINPSSFCLLTTEDETILNTCKKNKMYSVIPFIIDNNIYTSIKDNLDNNIFLIKELNYDNLVVAVNYLKSRGYEIVGLNKLLEL